MTVRFVPRDPPPLPPERVLWRLEGIRLPVVCVTRKHPHGTDLLVFQGDDLVWSAMIRTGPTDVESQAATWKRVLLEKGWRNAG